MLKFHDNSEYLSRECCAWYAQTPRPDDCDWRDDMREYFAGYCIDAIERSPAGCTVRIESRDLPPFAAPELVGYRF